MLGRCVDVLSHILFDGNLELHILLLQLFTMKR